MDASSIPFKAEDVALIVEARVEELFEYVQKELMRIHKARKCLEVSCGRWHFQVARHRRIRKRAFRARLSARQVGSHLWSRGKCLRPGIWRECEWL